MAIGSKELISSELDTFENERLVDELKKAKEELFNLRFQSATGQLESHGRLKSVKRDIARIYTVIRERELGIRAVPAPVVTEKAAKAAKSEKSTVKAPKAKAPKADAAVATEVEAPVADAANDEKPAASEEKK
jgi:large subunit ribosomal protein L29